MNARERFLDIARFERPNDPFVWSIWTWRETITRWKQEGDRVNFEGKKFNKFHLGYQDQREHLSPNAATVGMADDGGEPWGPPLDPFFEEEVLEEDERYIVKRALAKGKNEIDGEINKARILLREGGYFPCVAHGTPSDVPYENFLYFMNELRKLSDYEETRRLIPQSEENGVQVVQYSKMTESKQSWRNTLESDRSIQVWFTR